MLPKARTNPYKTRIVECSPMVDSSITSTERINPIDCLAYDKTRALISIFFCHHVPSKTYMLPRTSIHSDGWMPLFLYWNPLPVDVSRPPIETAEKLCLSQRPMLPGTTMFRFIHILFLPHRDRFPRASRLRFRISPTVSCDCQHLVVLPKHICPGTRRHGNGCCI